MDATTIKEAINNAITTVKEKFSSSSTEEKETQKEETNEESNESSDESSSEETKEEETPEPTKSEIDPKIVQEALRFYNILNDPDPKIVSAALKAIVTKAEKAGIEIDGITAKEQREVTTDILDILREEVPEENRELVDALGPALRKIIKLASEGSEAKLKDVEKQLKKFQDDAEAANYASTLNSILTKDKYEGYLPDMEKLMKTIQPVDGVSEEKYLDTLLKLVKAEKGERTTKQKTTKKIEKNAEEALPTSTVKGDNVIILDKAVDLKEAIRLAKEGKTVKYQAG